MHSVILEERPDDPALRDSYMPSPTEPARLSTSTLSNTSATLLPSPEKPHTAHPHPSSPHPQPDDQDPGNAFDTDLEAIIPTESACCRRARDDGSVWPGKEHWKRKAREAKRGRRTCGCMAALSRRTRIAVKIAIGLLIVGVAVGVGFGVSKPLGAPIWGDKAKDR